MGVIDATAKKGHNCLTLFVDLDTVRAYNLKLSFQAAKGRAKGYRNVKTLITIAYIFGSRFDYGLPKYCLC